MQTLPAQECRVKIRKVDAVRTSNFIIQMFFLSSQHQFGIIKLSGRIAQR